MHDTEVDQLLLAEQQIHNEIDGLPEQLSRDFVDRCQDGTDAVCPTAQEAAEKADVPVRYVGFAVPNEFAVGCGIDFVG